MTPSPRPPCWARLSIWRASSRTVLVSLLAGMLLVLGVTVGSMLFFSNLVVQRQINRLPPDLRDQFHDHGEPDSGAARGGAGTGNSGAGSSVTTAAGLVAQLQSAQTQGFPNTAAFTPPALIGPVQPLDPLKTPALKFQRRANGFLRDVGYSLWAASAVSAVFGLLLAFVLARRIARPISAVSEAASRVAAGDLSVRAALLPGDRETTELARSFNAMAHALELLEQERRDTVASIAHELRTPLTVMQARLDAIEDGIYPLNPEQVGHLSAQTQLLTRLVADLRTLSLAEAGRLTLQLAQVRALPLARSVAQDIQSARSGDIQVEVLGPEATLQADPDRLRQVLVNLTENAFKHARSRVQLTVQLGGQGEAQNLSVHIDDDGPGIPAPDREHVFERFVRLETSRSRDSGGSGLGLAVVRALMLAHGGDVELCASPLGGTRATVRFPQGEAN
ncbi:sensor histidine kinase [Deinococcus sp.]|uniref:sensor histidine kinase n=1 Tax=Deinococcus sp. TaxID=47478 RepID=UPI003CC577E9